LDLFFGQDLVPVASAKKRELNCTDYFLDLFFGQDLPVASTKKQELK